MLNLIACNIVKETYFSKYFSNAKNFRSNIFFKQNGKEKIEILTICANLNKGDSDDRLPILEIYKNINNQVIISNIFVPLDVACEDSKMKIIEHIYSLCEIECCDLFLDRMSDMFHEKMLKKGAVEINYEAVRITDETKLI